MATFKRSVVFREDFLRAVTQRLASSNLSPNLRHTRSPCETPAKCRHDYEKVTHVKATLGPLQREFQNLFFELRIKSVSSQLLMARLVSEPAKLLAQFACEPRRRTL